ncbi:MAG: inositol monophosphatase [Geminicoccaceae bacterium]
MPVTIDEEDLDRREEVCRAVIAEAGRLALDWFERRSSIAVALKGPQDYASEADAAVERMVRSRIAEAFPDDAFLGEEEGGEVGERVWVIDPIDGTANFVRGVARFCVSLAFVADGRVQLGAIVSPATGELYLARRGRGGTLNGAPLEVATTDRIERASIEIGWSSRQPYASYLQAIERMLAAGIDFRRFGSGAMGLAWVADGRADAYLELHINSWDCLAGILLVEEAGGRVNDFLANDGLRRGNPILAVAPGVADAISELAGVPLLP